MKNWDYYRCSDVPYPSLSMYASKEDWRKAKEEWVKVERQRYLEFKEDLFKEFGVENDHAKDVVFSKAWEDGHSSGYAEVYDQFGELLEFAKAIREAYS